MDFKQFYKTVQFDIDKEIRTVLQATQGDTKSRGLLVPVVVNSVVTPITTETMNFFALKPDGTRVMTVGVKDGDKFRIDFTNQTFSVAGTLLCALVLYGTNGEKIADKKFKMTVDSSLEDGAIISEDERGILDRAFELAEDIVPRMEALATLGERLDSTNAQMAETNQRIDNLVTTPVPVGEIIAQEIIDARQGADSVGANITEVKSQLAENAQQIEVVTKNPNNYKGAIVTIIDDDIKNEVKTVWLPVLNDTGAKMTFACITGAVGTTGYMSLEEIKDLQVQGHEIVSHSVTHLATSSIPVGTAEVEYPQSQQWLKDNGFKGYETLVYPGGMPVNRVDIKNVARKYYKYGVDTNNIIGVSYNTAPVDNWRVSRVQGDTRTLEQLKGYVDEAMVENGWLILMTHSHVVDPQKMRDFITYVQSKGVPIMPFGEASKYKGNAVALGEFTEEESTFISVDGASKIGGSLIVKTDSKRYIDEPVTSYKRNAQTIVPLSTVTDTFLGVGGVMDVFRGYHDSYSYATFKPVNSSKIYKRRWNHTTGLWRAWEDIIKESYSPGVWTPILKGATVAGEHTYSRQEGRFTKFANLMLATFTIRIEAADLDDAMTGVLQIHGLPEPMVSTFALPVAPVQYNNLTLPANYYNVIAKGRSNGSFVDLFINGSNVGENYLNKNHLTSGQPVIFSGQIIYQTN